MKLLISEPSLSTSISLVPDPQLDDFIEWFEGGRFLVIRRRQAFTDNALPIMSKHLRYSEFTRTSEMLSFDRVGHLEGEDVFIHPFFQRDCAELLSSIVRKTLKDVQQGHWRQADNNDPHAEASVDAHQRFPLADWVIVDKASLTFTDVQKQIFCICH